MSYSKHLHQLVLWCSWLSLLSNTQAVPGSNPGGIMFLPSLCLPLASLDGRCWGFDAGGVFCGFAKAQAGVGWCWRGFSSPCDGESLVEGNFS
jgi:hypothetical protein